MLKECKEKIKYYSTGNYDIPKNGYNWLHLLWEITYNYLPSELRKTCQNLTFKLPAPSSNGYSVNHVKPCIQNLI